MSAAAAVAERAVTELLEATAVRGASRARSIMRLPNGQFAPKGLGRELRAGDRVTVPHKSGTGTVGGIVEPTRAGSKSSGVSVRLTDGPDKDKRIRVRHNGAAAKPKTPVAKADQPSVTMQEIERLGLNDWPPKTAETNKVLGDAVDTQQLHQVDGVYTAERKVLHDQIVNKLLAGKTKQPGKPQALFMAGGAASGKSTALAKRPDFKPASAVEINPDEIKELLPEYQTLIGKRDRYAATAAHEESSDIAARLLVEAQERGLNVIVDGTGDSKRGKFAKKLKRMDEAGYDVKALYVTVPTDVAVSRAVKRAEKTGRFVPVPELRTQHRNVSAWFGDVAQLPFLKGLELFDTTTDPPTPLASAAGGKLNVRQQASYREFLDKGKGA